MKLKQSAAAVVLNQNEYEMIQEVKTNSRSMPNLPKDVPVTFTGFPGGKLDGKSIEQTLREELEEEAGKMLLQVGKHLCRVTKFDFLTNEKIVKDFYECTIDTSQPSKPLADPDGSSRACIKVHKDELTKIALEHPDQAIGRAMYDIAQGRIGQEYVWTVGGATDTPLLYVNPL